ncbi:phosphatase PAP2 family protein [Streptomyces sp. F63]|uniref:phosphatase PAP2 family protein n=1 Tax=Streptomyces sp. F63 TaxID=2824887 RepID=UPI001B37394E|nr:phosphatase PAP2 family protein [Streptomyces sp. F63]MBQ0983619.1 phosphatase PAP2 family protein [Streptomyces sp. F63]
MPATVSTAGAPIPTPHHEHGRLRWWAELPLIVLVYLAYSAGRLLVRGDVGTAVGHGLAILRFEQAFHLDAERPLNRWFTGFPALGVPAAFFYASLHYLVTPAVLVWLWIRRPARYRAARTWLLLSTVIGLAGFSLYPTCPPRLLEAGHGFVDGMARYASYGWWGGEASAPRGLGGLTNQYAAMPSLHVGWALWCGVVLWRYRRTLWTRVLAVGYPLLTTVVVMGTANHYFLDAAAGAGVMGLGLTAVRPALRLADRARERIRARHAASPAPGTVAQAVPDAPAAGRSPGAATDAGTAAVETAAEGTAAQGTPAGPPARPGPAAAAPGAAGAPRSVPAAPPAFHRSP